MSIDSIVRWWPIVFAVFAAIMYSSALVGYRVQEDARKRRLGKAAVTFWSVGVVFFGIIFLPLYLMFRSRAVFAAGKPDETDRVPFRLCPYCGEENTLKDQLCRKCHRRIEPGQPLQGSKQCPYCGTMNPVDASRCSNCDQVIGTDVED